MNLTNIFVPYARLSSIHTMQKSMARCIEFDFITFCFKAGQNSPHMTHIHTHIQIKFIHIIWVSNRINGKVFHSINEL